MQLREYQQNIEIKPKKSLDKSKVILPITFCLTIMFIGIINIQNLKQSYTESTQKHPEDIKKSLSEIEGLYAKSFIGKNNYININGIFSKIIGEKEINNIIKLENGYLTTPQAVADATKIADNIKEFETYLNKKEIPLTYIQVPYKTPTDNDEKIPLGFNTNANTNADNVLKQLEEKNIQTLDLRDEIQKDGLNHYDLFYKTDHHWNIYGGFWGHTKVVEHINETLGIDKINKEYTNIENYNIETIEDTFLGSRGKRTGAGFAGLDDTVIITPKFETDYSISIQSKDINNKTGNFKEVMFFEERIADESLDKYDPYSMYLGGNYDFVKIINNKTATNDKKIFLIRDSFSLALVPYLSSHYSEVYLYDLREGTQADMIQKIEQVNPDIVSIIYNPSVFGVEDMMYFIE